MSFTERMMGDNRTSGMLDLQKGSIMAEASRLNSQTEWTRVRQKKAVLVLIAGILVIALLIAGISLATGAGQYEVEPVQFKLSSTFRYPGLTWGMTVEETAYALPVAIAQDESLTSGDHTGYIAESGVKLDGEEGQATFTFEKERLDAVSLEFCPEEDAQAWFEAQMAAFTEQFGEPTERIDSAGEKLATTGGTWDSYDGSSLQLVLITGGREPIVTLSVGR